MVLHSRHKLGAVVLPRAMFPHGCCWTLYYMYMLRRNYLNVCISMYLITKRVSNRSRYLETQNNPILPIVIPTHSCIIAHNEANDNYRISRTYCSLGFQGPPIRCVGNLSLCVVLPVD